MHLCPRQVLGARMGLFGSQLLGIAISGNEKRLLVIVETDGCFADGVSVATSCTVGARTLRVIDHGKVAVVFVDTKSDRAVCDACGEEISNERETIQAGRVLCRACAGHQCWQLL